jgi:5-methyltetrahydrofolate--homocysteine methyltransferase
MDAPKKTDLVKIKESIIQGQYKSMAPLIREALEKGSKIESILNDYMIPAMVEVGDRFERHEIFIPEMMLAAKAMTIGFDILEPLLLKDGVRPLGMMVIGTVKGDFHEIGKNIVAAMMKGNGINVIDLGADVSPEQFIETMNSHQVQILGMSALLTTTMSQMERTIQMIVREGLRDDLKIMVGGGPITDGFALKIGADYYAPNAGAAVRTARDTLLNT